MSIRSCFERTHLITGKGVENIKMTHSAQDKQLTAPATPSRRISRLLVRIALGSLVVVLVLLFAGAAYQAIATWQDVRAFPPPGHLVDAGGYRLHLTVMGEANGKPTVVLEHGGSGLSSQWGWVQPEVAAVTRVVAYDRPGLGWSEAPPEQLDGHEVAQVLHRTLENAGIEGPYVLVGHSLGALLVRTFAEQYPEETVGLVLVDPRGVTFEGIFSEAELQEGEQAITILPWLQRLGILRLTGGLSAQAEGLPAQQYHEAVARASTVHHAEGLSAEWHYGVSAAQWLQERNGAAPQQPLIVLSAGQEDESFAGQARQTLTAQHAALVAASPQGEHRLVADAGHIDIVTHHEHAQAVTTAILELVESAQLTR
jgi:pimeloyl-ACP methyl ester carboxylesterase